MITHVRPQEGEGLLYSVHLACQPTVQAVPPEEEEEGGLGRAGQTRLQSSTGLLAVRTCLDTTPQLHSEKHVLDY